LGITILKLSTFPNRVYVESYLGMKMLAKPAQMPPGTLHQGLKSPLINQGPNVTSNPPPENQPPILALPNIAAPQGQESCMAFRFPWADPEHYRC
jgi:hypothetical protein